MIGMIGQFRLAVIREQEEVMDSWGMHHDANTSCDGQMMGLIGSMAS